MAKNFKRALKHLKSNHKTTKLDEKKEMLNEIPTMHTGGVYSKNPAGFRYDPPSPAKRFIPDVDGNWPSGVPGTPGATEYIRPQGYWVNDSDWETKFAPNMSNDSISESSTNTDGFIDAQSGTVKTLLPPNSRSFILGPLVDGYSYNHGYDDFTNIGYIQKDTRQFVLLATISGHWDATSHGTGYTARVWDGTSGQFTAYNSNFTLAMAQWFKDKLTANDFTKNFPYFYSGGVFQGALPSQPSGSPGGMLGGKAAGTGGGGKDPSDGDGKAAVGSGGIPDTGTETPQGDPEGGDAASQGYPAWGRSGSRNKRGSGARGNRGRKKPKPSTPKPQGGRGGGTGNPTNKRGSGARGNRGSGAGSGGSTGAQGGRGGGQGNPTNRRGSGARSTGDSAADRGLGQLFQRGSQALRGTIQGLSNTLRGIGAKAKGLGGAVELGFHGTSRGAARNIRGSGFKPGSRQNIYGTKKTFVEPSPRQFGKNVRGSGAKGGKGGKLIGKAAREFSKRGGTAGRGAISRALGSKSSKAGSILPVVTPTGSGIGMRIPGTKFAEKGISQKTADRGLRLGQNIINGKYANSAKAQQLLKFGKTTNAARGAKGLAKSAGRLAPGVGIALAGIDVAQRGTQAAQNFKNGNYAAASLDIAGAGLGALTAVPGPIGWAALAAQVGFDIARARGRSTQKNSYDLDGNILLEYELGGYLLIEQDEEDYMVDDEDKEVLQGYMSLLVQELRKALPVVGDIDDEDEEFLQNLEAGEIGAPEDIEKIIKILEKLQSGGEDFDEEIQESVLYESKKRILREITHPLKEIKELPKTQS